MAASKKPKKSAKKAAKKSKLPLRKDGTLRSDRESRKLRPVLRLDWQGNPITLTDQERYRKGGNGYNAWQAPEDMPDKQVKQVLAGKQCGAKCATKEGYCTNGHVFENKYKVPPYRCKYHGGMCTGAPKGNKNGMRHGLYSAAVLPGEEEAWEEIKAGNLDEEVRVTKLRLRRAVIVEAQLEAALAEGGGDAQGFMVLEQTEKKSGWGPETESYDKESRKLPDIKRVIHDIVTQLVKLENQRSLMSQGGGDLTAEERAAKAREFLREAHASIGGKS